MADLSISLAGMSRAESRVNAAAAWVARGSSPSEMQDTVDLSAEMIALMQGKNDFAVNAKVTKSFNEMNGSLLNILA